jgi:hypothetical protein
VASAINEDIRPDLELSYLDGQLGLTLPPSLSGPHLTMFDVHGRLMLDEQLTGAGRSQVELGQVPEGCYLVTITAGGNRRYTDRIVVIR